MKKYSAWIVALTLIFAAQLFSRQIETEIIQIKLNRIYFASGTEDGVKDGSQFAIVCDSNEVLSGVIEYSGPGISYSRPMAELDTLIVEPGCVAQLMTSGIDSSAIVTIGTDIPLRFFDPAHETIFIRMPDTLLPNLADSAITSGNELILYLRQGIRFADGQQFNSEILAGFLQDLQIRSRSYLVRYFFSRMLPEESGGIELIDGYTIRLRFYYPFPMVAYFLSHPDFAVYDHTGAGTGPLAEYPDPESNINTRVFAANRHYRGEPVAFSKLIIRNFEQQYRMKFAYENGRIDGFIGFGFEADLAGTYDAKALYPETAVMVSGIGSELFSQARFPTSIYYRFNPSLAHIYFQYGETLPVNRWLASSDSAGSRFYPFDFINGKKLHESIRLAADTARLAYNNSNLYETTRYMADIIAREGMTAPVSRNGFDGGYDIRLTYFPSSDSIMPFALIAAVLEFNDQNSTLPQNLQFDRPGWNSLGQGSRLKEIRNRNNFFSRAEETVVQDGGFLPLFRPYVYAVSKAEVKGLSFNFYGFPMIEKTVKFVDFNAGAVSGGGR